MKRFFRYIFILTIFASILAPISTKNKVYALEYDFGTEAKLEIETLNETLKIIIIKKGDNYAIYSFILKQNDKQIDSKSIDYTKFDLSNPGNFKNYVEFNKLNNGKYDLYLQATATDGAGTQETKYSITVGSDSKQDLSVDSSVSTNSVKTKSQDPSTLPACSVAGGWFGGEGTFVGCIAQGIYYVIFVPTSWLFGGAGQFFDWMFDYSVDSASYKTSFVSEGWKIVRDLCNIFFIFILLYVAFSLILGLGNAKAKEMIVNVIIIGLLINFSMFFAKVVIDSGNILARVFYNSETLREKAGNEKLDNEISLSSGIVDIVNPQKIIKNASKVTVEDPLTEKKENAGEDGTKNLGTGGFILVTILASVINIIGIFVFISVALIFVARTIGLYFIMIFAPFAFLSYTIPALKKIKMLGWDSWLNDLVSLSFVAPLFMFMLYLIILFAEKGFGDIVQEQNTGTLFVLSVMIPFILIAVMLLMAKKLAKDYSGSIGQAVVKGVNTVAGVAGGVALGAGAITARQTVGRGSAWMGRQDWLNNAASKGNSLAIGLKKLTNVGEKASFDARKTVVGAGIAKETGVDLDKTSKFVGLGTNRTEGGYTGYREREVKKEEEFGKTLGVDGKKETNIKTDITNTKRNIETEKTNIDNAKVIMASNPKTSTAYKNAARSKAVAEKNLRTYEKTLADQKEALERNQSGRAREYYQYKRKQSGRIVSNPEKRDYYDNIEEYAEMGEQTGTQIGKQMLRGLANSFGDAGIVGGVTLAFAGASPAIAAALATAALSATRRAVQTYSGTYNRRVGDTSNQSPRGNP